MSSDKPITPEEITEGLFTAEAVRRELLNIESGIPYMPEPCDTIRGWLVSVSTLLPRALRNLQAERQRVAELEAIVEGMKAGVAIRILEAEVVKLEKRQKQWNDGELDGIVEDYDRLRQRVAELEGKNDQLKMRWDLFAETHLETEAESIAWGTQLRMASALYRLTYLQSRMDRRICRYRGRIVRAKAIVREYAERAEQLQQRVADLEADAAVFRFMRAVSSSVGSGLVTFHFDRDRLAVRWRLKNWAWERCVPLKEIATAPCPTGFGQVIGERIRHEVASR